ncbi:uncharacterized protein [Euphorbia lathyris]|uniref:uncharacterized protein isoform X3 n=1 Tax=Euphorbia lathyris TaxID=212925 RepID=UPI003313CD62
MIITIPNEDERAKHPPFRKLGIFLRYLKWEMTFPLPRGVVAVLNEFNLSPCQITLNSWLELLMFDKVCTDLNVYLTVHLFWYFWRPTKKGDEDMVLWHNVSSCTNRITNQAKCCPTITVAGTSSNPVVIQISVEADSTTVNTTLLVATEVQAEETAIAEEQNESASEDLPFATAEATEDTTKADALLPITAPSSRLLPQNEVIGEDEEGSPRWMSLLTLFLCEEEQQQQQTLPVQYVPSSYKAGNTTQAKSVENQATKLPSNS